jgi:hypothetical protein
VMPRNTTCGGSVGYDFSCNTSVLDDSTGWTFALSGSDTRLETRLAIGCPGGLSDLFIWQVTLGAAPQNCTGYTDLDVPFVTAIKSCNFCTASSATFTATF